MLVKDGSPSILVKDGLPSMLRGVARISEKEGGKIYQFPLEQ